MCVQAGRNSRQAVLKSGAASLPPATSQRTAVKVLEMSAASRIILRVARVARVAEQGGWETDSCALTVRGRGQRRRTQARGACAHLAKARPSRPETGPPAPKVAKASNTSRRVLVACGRRDGGGGGSGGGSWRNTSPGAALGALPPLSRFTQAVLCCNEAQGRQKAREQQERKRQPRTIVV